MLFAIPFYSMAVVSIFKFTSINVVALILSAFISFVISIAVLEKLNYSKYRVIRFFQQFCVYFFVMYVVTLIIIFFLILWFPSSNTKEVVLHDHYSNDSHDIVPSLDNHLKLDFLSINYGVGDVHTPLEGILYDLLTMTILDSLLIIILGLLIFHRHISSFYVSIMRDKFLIKYFPNSKITKWYVLRLKSCEHTNSDYDNNKLILLILLLMIAITIFIMIVLAILFINIDSFVDVHIYLKKSSVLLFSICASSSTYNRKFHSINLVGSLRLFSTKANIIDDDLILEKKNDESNQIDRGENYNDNLVSLSLSEKLDHFGTYENYLNALLEEKAVTDEFIQNYYPNLINDEFFRLFLNELNPAIRTEVKYILNLYQYIIKFNIFKDRLFLLNDYLSKDLIYKLLNEFKQTREELIENLGYLGYSDNEKEHVLNKLLFNINKSLKNKLILEKSILGSATASDEEFYLGIDFWEFIENTMKKDVNENSNNGSSYMLDIENRYKEMETFYFQKIVKLIKFIELNNNLDSINIDKILNKYQMDVTLYSKTDKLETYKIKKGDKRTKKMSHGSIISGYKYILENLYKELESHVLKIFNDLYDTKTIKNDLIKDADVIAEKIQTVKYTIEEDFNLIYEHVTDAFKIDKFILDISRNLTETNLKEQYVKMNTFFEDMFKKNTHDELINVYKAIQKYNMNYFRIDDLSLKRENNLSLNSFLYIKCREIISDQRINLEHKQTLLEKFILSYEKEFTLNIIKNMDSNVTDFKLLTRIYKHSTPQFINRIQILIENNNKNKYTKFKNGIPVGPIKNKIPTSNALIKKTNLFFSI